MSTTSRHQTTSPFFFLPAEIRNQIYAHLFTFPSPLSISFPPHTTLQNEPSKPSLKHIPNILLINKQFTIEALPVLYSTNTFRTSTTSTLATFLTDIGPANRSHVKRLEASLWISHPPNQTITNSNSPPSPSQTLVSTVVASGMHTPTEYFALPRTNPNPNPNPSLGERRREAVGRSTASSTTSTPFTTFTSTAPFLPESPSLTPLLVSIPNLQLFRIEIFARVTPRPSPMTIAMQFEDLFRGLYERFERWDRVLEVVRFDGIERTLGRECVRLGHTGCVALMLGEERGEWVGELRREVESRFGKGGEGK